MKKRIIAISLLLILITLSVSASNQFQLEQVFYPIYSNDKLVPEDELPTLSYNDRTYVPLRKLSEATGLGVYFDDETQSISIYNEPLYQAQVNVLIADAYHDMIALSETFADYDNNLNLTIRGINNNYNISNNYEHAVNYLEEFLPYNIQQLEDKIDFLAEIYENDMTNLSLNKSMADLKQRLNRAKTAYTYATKCYELVGNYIKYRDTYYLDFYYGDNQDGYSYLLLDAYFDIKDYAEQEYDYYISLAIE